MDRADSLCRAADLLQRLRPPLRLPTAQEVGHEARPRPLQGRGLQHEEEVQENRAHPDIERQREALSEQGRGIMQTWVSVTAGEPPDMMSASEGEGDHGKVDAVREVV